MLFRKAGTEDVAAIVRIFEETHTCEERGETSIGWVRGVYPTEKTAQDAIQRDDLFVLEEKGSILGCAIINQLQVDVYAGAPWRQAAKDEDVMMLHTLVIAPDKRGRGLGPAFVNFYEQYAREQGCPFLRMDTNARNIKARAMYRKLGYEEIGVVPCRFNGIEGVQLVLLEKYLG